MLMIILYGVYYVSLFRARGLFLYFVTRVNIIL